MYKVIIIDDEPLLLRGIKKSIEFAHSQYQVIETISDSECAADRIEQLLPDVIFTDIKMPIVDGLALIAELNRRQIRTKIIILSGYQDFNYAKQALQYGVNAYLLKPIDIQELSQLLQNIYEELEHSRTQTEYDMLEQLVHSPVGASSISTKVLNHFSSYTNFGAILLCSGSNCTFKSNWITPSKGYWFKIDLPALIKEHLSDLDVYWIFDFDNGNDKVIILADFMNGSYNFTDICNKLYTLLNSHQFPITLVTGEPFKNISELCCTIQYYKILLAQNLSFGYSKFMFQENIKVIPQQTELPIPNEYQAAFALYIKKQHAEQFKFEFKKLLTDYCQKKATQLKLEAMLKQLISMFQENTSMIDHNRLLSINMEIDEILSNSITYDHVLNGMYIMFDDLFSLLKYRADQTKENTITAKQVEEYIRQNFTKSISLQSISSTFGFTHPYLSSIFKKYKGVPPMEFIIELRIEKAKKLLKVTPPLPLKEIAESIGYEDPYYMSRIFKSVTGKNPTQYRIDNLK